MHAQEAAAEEVTLIAVPEGRANSFVGTEEYLAPEVINGVGHTAAVDWCACAADPPKSWLWDGQGTGLVPCLQMPCIAHWLGPSDSAFYPAAAVLMELVRLHLVRLLRATNILLQVFDDVVTRASRMKPNARMAGGALAS